LFVVFCCCYNSDEQARLEEQRRWLDQEMEMVLQQRKAVEELERVFFFQLNLCRNGRSCVVHSRVLSNENLSVCNSPDLLFLLKEIWSRFMKTFIIGLEMDLVSQVTEGEQFHGVCYWYLCTLYHYTTWDTALHYI
jgi:hypothetical protein